MLKILRNAVGASVLLGAGYLYLIAPRLKTKGTPTRDPFRVSYAHRGLHGAGVPENSLTAFSEAVKPGYGIELDLQLSRDGKVMVFHDENLLRMTGEDRKLSDLDADELRALTLRDTNEKIPYFSEVLQLVNGRVPLLIELKGTSATDMRLCEKAEALLRGYDGPFCVESFNPMQIRWWKKHRPDIVRGQLVTNLIKKENGAFSKNPRDYLLTPLLLNVFSRPDFIAADGRMKNPSVTICEKLFSADRFVWTVKGNELRKSMLEEKAYPIFEYYPADFSEKPEKHS